MNGFSVTMAIFDYIPVALFIIAMTKLTKGISSKMSTISKYMFICGVCLVGAAGFIKATYKLLCGLYIGDFIWMSNQFFSNQSIGFLLAGLGLLLSATKLKARTYGFLPTMALVGIMVLGLGILDGSLIALAKKLKKNNAIVCFIFSFIFCLAMGYLSSKDFTKSYMNWIAQFINTFGQGLLLLGVCILEKAGFDKLH